MTEEGLPETYVHGAKRWRSIVVSVEQGTFESSLQPPPLPPPQPLKLFSDFGQSIYQPTLTGLL